MNRSAVVLFLLAPYFVAAQIEISSQFETASVKPAQPGAPYGGMRGGPGTGSPGQIHYDAVTLRAVVAKAYNLQRFQIEGPGWFDDERFDIVAKVPPGTTTQQFQLMLQNLLTDRFHLAFHKQDRSLAVYEMTVAKSGIKMKPVPLPATPARPTGDAAGSSTGMEWTSSGEKMELHVAPFRYVSLLFG